MRALVAVSLFALGCGAQVNEVAQDAACVQAEVEDAAIDATVDVPAHDTSSPSDVPVEAPVVTEGCPTVIGVPSANRCLEACTLVVRLDHDSKKMLGYQSFCDPPRYRSLIARTSIDGAKLMARGFLQSAAEPETTLDGYDFALLHVPSTTSGGSIVLLDADVGRVVFAATLESSLAGGEIIYPPLPAFRSPPAPAAGCSTIWDGDVSSIVAPGDAPIDAALAHAVVDAAWNNAVGYAYAPHILLGGQRAAIFRYAPTWHGTPRDWVVVFRGGPACCSGDC